VGASPAAANPPLGDRWATASRLDVQKDPSRLLLVTDVKRRLLLRPLPVRSLVADPELILPRVNASAPYLSRHAAEHVDRGDARAARQAGVKQRMVLLRDLDPGHRPTVAGLRAPRCRCRGISQGHAT